MSAKKPMTGLRYAVDGAPAVVFLVVLVVTHQFRDATWGLIASSLVALAVGLALERRIAPIPAFSAGAALIFGGLSLILHRNDILQMKMTIVDTALGGALFIGLALGRNPLKLLLGGVFNLPDAGWRTLAVRYGLFWFACAIANEYVRRTQTTEVWAMFRVGAIAAAVLFAVAQTPYLMKHALDQPASEPPGPPEPPEPGF